MLQLLQSRETGQLSGRYLKCLESTRRVSELELNRNKEADQIFTTGVNSIDLECQDHRYLIAGTSGPSIAIFDTENTFGRDKFVCKTVGVISRGDRNNHKFSVETVQWYPHDTGIFISSSVDGFVKVWDTNVLQVADYFHLPGYVYCHEMSSIATKHSLVAAACENSRVHLCDLKSGSSIHILKGHQKAVLAVAWSPRCEYILATGSRDNQTMVWDIRRATGSLVNLDLHNGKRQSRFKSCSTAHNGHVNALRFTSDGLHLLTLGTDDRLRLWDMMTCRNTLVNYGRVMDVTRKKVQFDVTAGISPEMAFVPNGDAISVFEIFTGNQVATLRGHFSDVNACCLDGEKQELWSAGSDTHVLVWAHKKRTVQADRHGDSKGEELIKGGQLMHPAYQDCWSSDEGDA